MDFIKLNNLPYDYWKNRAREIPNEEFIKDPKNAKKLEPLMRAESDFQVLLTKISETKSKLAELKSSEE